MRTTPSFKLMSKPSIYGYEATTPNDIRIEVVRCYSSDWSIFTFKQSRYTGKEFMTDHCRQGLLVDDNRKRLQSMSYPEAMREARLLYKSICAETFTC